LLHFASADQMPLFCKNKYLGQVQNEKVSKNNNLELKWKDYYKIYVPGAVITCTLHERNSSCYLTKKYENCYLLEMYLRKLNMFSILFFDNNKLTVKKQRYTLNVTLIFRLPEKYKQNFNASNDGPSSGI
jgi:hypothetical protein